MSKPLAFVLCAEKGPLERMTLLFVRSLRRFGGPWRHAPVYTYAPRPGLDISVRTRTLLKGVDVEHRHLFLNTAYRELWQANKPAVMAHAERSVDADFLIFVDSDMLLVSPPDALVLPDRYSVALRPVDLKGIGASGPEDRKYRFWEELYRHCGSELGEWYVQTTVDRQRILAYWNAGLIAVRRRAGMCQRWNGNYHRVMRSGMQIDRDALLFMDQCTLAATVSSSPDSTLVLPAEYNCPVHFMREAQGAEWAPEAGDLVALHYHSLFGRRGQAAVMLNMLPETTKLWLVEQLALTGVCSSTTLGRLGGGASSLAAAATHALVRRLPLAVFPRRQAAS